MLQEEIERLEDINDAEKIKLKIEYEKIRIERYKIWGTVFSIMVPLAIGIATIILSIILQYDKEKTEFELKAAEIVMNAESPRAATNKAAVLVELFPDRLNRRFFEILNKRYGNSE